MMNYRVTRMNSLAEMQDSIYTENLISIHELTFGDRLVALHELIVDADINENAVYVASISKSNALCELDDFDYVSIPRVEFEKSLMTEDRKLAESFWKQYCEELNPA